MGNFFGYYGWHHAHPHLAEADGHHEAGQLQARFQGGFGDGSGLAGAKSSEAVGKALYAQTDARKFQDYVVTDTPAPGGAPRAARGVGFGGVERKQGAPRGALLWFVGGGGCIRWNKCF